MLDLGRVIVHQAARELAQSRTYAPVHARQRSLADRRSLAPAHGDALTRAFMLGLDHWMLDFDWFLIVCVPYIRGNGKRNNWTNQRKWKKMTYKR